MGKTLEYTLERAGSHSVSATQGGDRVTKEEVFLYFLTEWRGQACRVTVECNRYEYAGGDWSEWRVFARGVRTTSAERPYGDELSQTARARLGETLVPVAHAWLVSPDYAESRRNAFRSFMRNAFRDNSKVITDEPTRYVRGTLAKYAIELDASDVARFTAAADAFDAYAAALNGADR